MADGGVAERLVHHQDATAGLQHGGIQRGAHVGLGYAGRDDAVDQAAGAGESRRVAPAVCVSDQLFQAAAIHRQHPVVDLDDRRHSLHFELGIRSHRILRLETQLIAVRQGFMDFDFDIEDLAMLCRFYNISADYIIGLTDEEKPYR